MFIIIALILLGFAADLWLPLIYELFLSYVIVSEKTHRYKGFDATCNFRQAPMVLGLPLMHESGRSEHTHQHSSLWNKTVGSPIFSSTLKHFFLYSYIGPFHLLPPNTTNSILRNTLNLFSPSSSRESPCILLNIGAEVEPLNWHTLDRCLLPESISCCFSPSWSSRTFITRDLLELSLRWVLCDCLEEMHIVYTFSLQRISKFLEIYPWALRWIIGLSWGICLLWKDNYVIWKIECIS